jgi:hypothetical protein
VMTTMTLMMLHNTSKCSKQQRMICSAAMASAP